MENEVIIKSIQIKEAKLLKTYKIAAANDENINNFIKSTT